MPREPELTGHPDPDRVPPVVLTIAGSDSGGGAGLQADLKTFSAFRVFGTSVVTAVTAQNTLAVGRIHAIPVDVVRAQMDSVAEDLRPGAVKTGMLATADLIGVVANGLTRHELRPYVLDPVMVATSGDRLLDPDAEETMRALLLPLATLITPNLHEARILTGLPVEDVAGMGEAARSLVHQGAGAALVKGGHLGGPEAVDLLWDGTHEHVWRRPMVATRGTHGTGCTLSAAVVASLALGFSLGDAASTAIEYVAEAIRTAPGLGGGQGPVNHFADPFPL